MTNHVNLSMNGEIAVIRVSNPPVNALSHSVRTGLQSRLAEALVDEQVKAIVICRDGRSFIAGADIREFGKPSKEPILPELIDQFEASPVPVVAAIHGNALGGGLELALGAHYRVALEGSQVGLPEVTLGLLPGAGGTQRLPRLIGMKAAAEMITGGKPLSASKALALGLVDKIVNGADICAAGVEFAKEVIAEGKGPRPISRLDCKGLPPEDVQKLRAKITRSAKGAIAPLVCLQALDAASELSFPEGMKRERQLFLELMDSDQRAALMHAFFSERWVGKLPEIKGVEPRAFAQIGVIGGGTMGAGIAVSALLNGLDVTLAERDFDAAEAAKERVAGMLADAVARGKLAEDKRTAILATQFRATANYEDFSETDLVIEAVFESMEVKKEVFSKLDQVCRRGAILASNTSYLNINEIAVMTKRPQDVIGLHFFSPAHVMRLLEVVVGAQTAPDAVATGFALAKKLRKIAVRAGVCDGFIGNRVLSHYNKAIYNMVLAGASPFAVDKALTKFGLAMGPFAVSDLAGLDIGWANRKRLAPTRDPEDTYPEFADRLCEMGRFGRKTGRGFYIYDEGVRTGQPDPEVDEIIAAERAEKGVLPRDIDATEIVDRYMAAMVNEAARIVEEGIALRPLDVDVTLLNGYGFPRWRGGPMQYADTVGVKKILNDIKRFGEEGARFWQPAPLLERLAAEKKTFASLND